MHTGQRVYGEGYWLHMYITVVDLFFSLLALGSVLWRYARHNTGDLMFRNRLKDSCIYGVQAVENT
jgi:hypothetical protein